MQSSAFTDDDFTKRYSLATDALYEIASEYYTLGKLNDAQRLLNTSLQLLKDSTVQQEKRLKLLLLYSKALIVAHMLARQGTDLMFSTILETQQTAEALQNQQASADALSLLGQAHLFATIAASLKNGLPPDNPQNQQKYAIALGYQEQALKLREALHDMRGVSESHFFIGNAQQFSQQIESAQEHFAQAIEIAEQYNHPYEKTEPTRHLALFAMGRGDLDQALAYARQALALREEARFKPFLPLDHLLLRSIYLAQGDRARARFHEREAVTLAEEMGYTTLVSSIIDAEKTLAGREEGV